MLNKNFLNLVHVKLLVNSYKINADVKFVTIQHFIVVMVFLTLLLLIISYFASLSLSKNVNQLSEYECGFEPFDNATRSPFDVQFYIVGILFLLFDVEIALLFPWVVGSNYLNVTIFYLGLFFITFLSLGFFYEWNIGALSWSKQKKSFFVYGVLFQQPSAEFKVNFPSNYDILESTTLDVVDQLYFLNDSFFVYIICTAVFFISSTNFKRSSTIKSNKLFVNPVLTSLLAVCLILYTLTLILFLIMKNTNQEITLLNDETIVGSTTVFSKILLLVSVFIVLISSKNFFLFNKNSILEFSFLMVFNLFFLLCLVSSYSFITIFSSLLAGSIVLYSLMGLDKTNHSSREATMKYFVLSALASGLLGYSLVLTLLVFLTSNFWQINLLLPFWNLSQTWVSSFNFDGIIVLLSFWLSGIFFKLGAFPCHLWSPDVYQGSSNPIVVLFVLPIKIGVFFVTIKTLSWVFFNFWEMWSCILYFSSFFSILWGCLGSLVEQSFKKFIAYSSINQMGFLLLGLTCANFHAIKSTIIYLIIYITANLIIFVIFLQVKTKKTSNSLYFISDFSSFYSSNFGSSILLAISLFSLAGIPPLGGFFGKFYLFAVALYDNYISLVVLGMATSLISSFYYLNIVSRMSFLTLKIQDVFFCSFTNFQTKVLAVLTLFLVFYFLLFF